MKKLTIILLGLSILVACEKESEIDTQTPSEKNNYFGIYSGDSHFIGESYYRQDSLGNWTNNPYDYHLNPSETEVKPGIWDQSKLMLYYRDKNDSLLLFYDSEFQLDSNGVFHDTVPGGSSYKYTYIKFKGDSIIADRFAVHGRAGGHGEIHIKAKKQ
ncbi:hypothetical protein Oweho_1498 [Owenweeksia hongkongensis DSM 17368]|uniref:Uncharacterized protein n=2 Tax=Owenweeksia TaxID=267986 RepID=G8R8Q9_OWEHD|nr:hypothetical protein [Owenweeksia hongkongensis]AEV32489.1 hypothetical protein Oweho_1498 [Owenweeksia hongkongensis DSM 17368]